MTILVEIQAGAGQRTGDWIVRNGAGGRILSRHRLKSAAVRRGRREARSRETDLKIQQTNGQWRQGPGY